MYPAGFSYRAKSRGAYVQADSTLYALTLVNHMYHSFAAGDGIGGAIPHAYKAALALISENMKRDKFLAYLCRTSFPLDMCFVLLTEVVNGG